MKISVIIPAYNAENYIREALESALSQSRPPDEVLVVDDGSTDATADVVKAFGRDVRLIQQTNHGASYSRNRAVAEARNEWVAFLDGDDVFLPGKLQQQAELALAPECRFVYTGHTCLYPDGRTLECKALAPVDLWPTLRYRSVIVPSTVLVSREAFLEVGGFDQRFHGGEDWDLWVRFCSRYSPRAFRACPDPLITYRITPGSVSSDTLGMLQQNQELLETTLLTGTRGIQRWLWRRRISARILYEAAIVLREQGKAGSLRCALKSMLNWPLPGQVVPLRRYLFLAHIMIHART